MAKTIDQRVVSMEFDNKNFEKNVSTSMSTLDKLKEKLNFRGASKAMDELNGSLKSVNTSVLEKAIDGVGTKFNTLEQIAIGALRRIGEQAVNTAEQLIKAMSVDNIAAGFEKFGNKTTSVATLVAQGYDIEKVEEELEKLNFFTDETSYNFVDMVGNIGKFTAAGQGLEESLTAMQGIATWAALSGQNAATASRAMYQLSQAMGSGVMRKEDYKSIQNASMDTREFRQRAIEAGLALGTLQEVSEGVYKSISFNPKEIEKAYFTIDQFADHLTEDGWFTSDVMMTIYKDYGKASNTLIKYLDKYSNELDTANDAMNDIEEKANAYAQKMKEAGSALSEEDLFDEALKKVSLDEMMTIPSLYQEAEEFMKEYNANLKDGETKITDVRDALIEMGYGIDAFSLKAFKAAQAARTWEDVIDSVKDAVSTGWMNTFQNIFGNEEEAVSLWTRMANDFWDIFASGGEGRNAALEAWREYVDPVTRTLLAANDAISSMPESAKQAQDEVIKALANGKQGVLDGRELLFGTDEEKGLGAVVQLLQNLKDLLGIIKDAWNEIFFGTTDADELAQKKADILMDITKAIKAFADALKISDEDADKLRRTFKGLFAILDIIGYFISSVLSVAFELIGSLFGATEGSVLDLTASLGDNLVALRDWIKQHDVFTRILKAVADGISTVIGWIKTGVDYLLSIPWVADAIEKVRAGFEATIGYIKEFFDRLAKGEKAGDIISDIGDKIAQTSPFIQWLLDTFAKVKEFFGPIFKAIGEFFVNVWAGIKEFWRNLMQGFQNAGNGIAGFWDGTKSFFENIKNAIGGFIEYLKANLPEINAKKIIGIVGGVLLFMFLFKILNLFNSIKSALAIFEDIKNGIVNVTSAFSKAITNIGKAVSVSIRAQAIFTLAKAILVLVGAITVMYFLNTDKLVIATGILIALIGMMIILANSAGKITANLKSIVMFGAVMMSFVGTVLVLAAALKLLEGIELGNSWQGIVAITVIAAAIAALSIGTMWLLSKIKTSNVIGQVKNLAIMLVLFGGALLLAAAAIKMLASEKWDSLLSAGGALLMVLGGMGAILVAIGAAVAFMQKAIMFVNFKSIAGFMLGLAASLLIVTASIKLISKMDSDSFRAGIIRIGLMMALVGAVVVLSRFAGENASSAGKMLLSFATALLILVGVIALVNLLDGGTIIKGILVIGLFEVMAMLFVEASQTAGQHAAKAGVMLLSFAGAMAILVGVIWAISFLPIEDLLKGLLVISVIGIIMAGLIAVTKLAAKSKSLYKNLIVLTVAIGVLAASVAILSAIGPEKAIVAATAMAIVLAALALVIATLKLTKDMGKVMGTLIVITVAIGVIGGILFLLTNMGIKASEALIAATSVSMVLAVFAGVIVLLSKTVQLADALDLAVGLVAMLALNGIIALIAQTIINMNDIDASKAIVNATAVTELLVAMAGVLAIVSIFGSNWMGIAVGALGMYAMNGVIALIAQTIINMNDLDAEKSISHAHSLGDLLLAMSGAMVILGVAGVLAAPALVASLIMGVVVENLKNMIQSLGEQEPAIREFIDKGIPLLEELGTALGTFFGNIVGGFISGAVNGALDILPTFGTKLSDFSNNVKPFIDNMSKIDSTVIDNASSLATAILKLTAAEVLESITSFAGFKMPDTADFGDKITSLGTAMAGFIDAINGKEIGENVKDAVGYLEQLAALQPDPNADWNNFGDNLGFLGTGIAAFNDAVNGKLNPVSMGQATSTLRSIAEISSQIGVQTGSLWGAIAGNKDLGSFAGNLKTLGDGIGDFSVSVDGRMRKASVEAAIKALNEIKEVGTDIKAGSIWTVLFTGLTDIQQFGNSLKALGTGIGDFSANVDGKVSLEQCENAAKAISTVVGTLYNGDGGMDGFNQFMTAIGWFEGADKFKEAFPKIGEAISGFSKKVGGGAIQVTACENAVRILGGLVQIDGISALTTALNDETQTKNFGDRLTDLGKGLAGFSNELAGADLDAAEKATNVLGLLALIEQNVTAKSAFGFVQVINDLTATEGFKKNLKLLGEGLNGFAVSLNANNVSYGTVSYSVKTAIEALGQLAQIQTSVNGANPWEFIQKIANMSGLNAFSANIIVLGRGLIGFAQVISSGGTYSSTGVTKTISLIQSISELNTVLDVLADETKINGYIDKIGKYADAIDNLKGKLESLYEAADGFDINKLDNVQATMDKFSSVITGDVTKLDVTSFSGAASSIPEEARKYMDQMNLGDYANYTVTTQASSNTTTYKDDLISAMYGGSSSDYLKAFENAGVSGSMEDALKTVMGGLDFSGMSGDLFKNFGISLGDFDLSSLGNVFGDGADNILGGLSGALNGLDFSNLSGDLFKNLGISLGDLDISSLGNIFGDGASNIIGGLSDALNSDESKEELEKAGSDMVGNVLDGARQKVADFAQVGKNSVNGFINAMTAMFPQVKETGTELAKNLETGLTMTLKIQSPSKVMYGLGEFVGQGLINGIKDTEVDVGNESEALGNAVNDRLQTALNNVSDYLDLNIDTNPTITPVLDLSNVNTGVEQLDSMFDTTRSVNLAGSVNAAMGTANMNVQNEIKVDNSDIVKSLAELRSDMSIMGDKISKLQVRMDTGALVGELVSPMDKALGERSIRRGRL